MARIIPGVSKETEATILALSTVLGIFAALVGICVWADLSSEISASKYSEYAGYSRQCPPLKKLIELKMADHKITANEEHQIDQWIKDYNKAVLFGLPVPEVK